MARGWVKYQYGTVYPHIHNAPAHSGSSVNMGQEDRVQPESPRPVFQRLCGRQQAAVAMMSLDEAIEDARLAKTRFPDQEAFGVTAIGNTLYAVGDATKAGHVASTNLVGALTFS